LARVRRPRSDDTLPPTRGPGASALASLLGARRFRLGAGCERIAQNLSAHGGEVAGDAAAWIGLGRPPADAPSVALDDFPGTLGPRSFGFLNNVGGVAALDAPLPSLPRRGSLALVVPRRDALPDLGPLAVARGLGLSWIVSIGDGDPAEALAFLAADPATTSLAVALGDGATGATLRPVLGAKPSVVLGGDELCRAVVRRAGAIACATLDEWLARAALLDAAIEPGSPVGVIVVGGGRAWVERELRSAGLDASLSTVDERAPAELEAAIAAAGRPVIVVATSLAAPDASAGDLPRSLHADLRHPEALRALLTALAAPPIEPGGGRTVARVDKELVAKVRAEVETALSDHDAKRLLKAYGVRVTRQAPTGTPTQAMNLARQIGLPVVLALGDDLRVVETLPEVRRAAALMLPKMTPGSPLMVRERFPDAPRARARVAVDKGLGLTLRVGDAVGLVPLTRLDAEALAATTSARRAADQRAVADLLTRIAACAAGEQALFELELYVGAEPAVLTAKGELRR
jgi:hypothetical protein